MSSFLSSLCFAFVCTFCWHPWVYLNRIFIWHPNQRLKSVHKISLQYSLLIEKVVCPSWLVCCCFIFDKTAWLWSIMVIVFVSFGFERTKICLWDCLWRELDIGKTPWKEDMFGSLLTWWLMVCFLKSLKVLKWGNLELSCVAGKFTKNGSKQAWILKLN